MKLLKYLFLFVFIIIAVMFFWYFTEDHRDAKGSTLVHSEADSLQDAPSYYIKIKGDRIIIYNKDHSVYEYTDLEPEFLQEDITLELERGIHFRNQEELYEFLETYSS